MNTLRHKLRRMVPRPRSGDPDGAFRNPDALEQADGHSPVQADEDRTSGAPYSTSTATPVGAASGKRRYCHPRLHVIATADELLDALGPAQASYGGTGVS